MPNNRLFSFLIYNRKNNKDNYDKIKEAHSSLVIITHCPLIMNIKHVLGFYHTSDTHSHRHNT